MSVVAAKPKAALSAEPRRQTAARLAHVQRAHQGRARTEPPGPQLPAYVHSRGRRPLAPLARTPAQNAPPAVRSVASQGGAALAPSVRAAVEHSVGVDLSPVRVHQSPAAAALADQADARAFAIGADVFLGSREDPGDLALIAHEVAHVLQQQGDAAAVQHQSPGAADPFEQEADRVSAAAVGGRSEPVVGRTSVRPQYSLKSWVRDKAAAAADVVSSAAGAVVDAVGDVIGVALEFIRDHARAIPGYDMLGFILGRDPITQAAVPRNAANMIRAVMGLWPGGALVLQALDAHHLVDRVGAWLEQQFGRLRAVAGGIRSALDQFLRTLGPGDLLHLGAVWERARRIFSEPIGQAGQFIAGLAADVLRFIRDAILLPLARLAEGTRGYDLLKAVLGRDPITGEPVPQDPETLIGGFMKFIGEEEVWLNVKRSNAIPRVLAWFRHTLVELRGFVQQVPATFIAAFTSLEIADLILVPRAFAKLARVFGGFAVRFVTWAGGAVWNLLEIIFDVVSPGALGYIRRTGAALKSILKNPLPFVGNLVRAAKTGFLNFADHFLEHLKAGMLDWLLGALPGVYIPKAFELGEIVKFVFSVLGLSWQNIRGKLVKVVGETVVTAMETGFDIVVTLVREGPAAAWDKIKEELSHLKDTVIGGITDFIVDTVVKKAIPKLIAMFIPGAGFISAILSIYDTVMVFVQKISKIIQVVTSFIDSIVAIAAGAIDAAAARVESILSGLLSLAINFLAGFIGLGSVADKIKGVLEKIRGSVDKALDALIAWIVKMAKSLFAKVKSAVSGWWNEKVSVDIEGTTHTLYFEGDQDDARPYVKASPGRPVSEYLNKEWKRNGDKDRDAAHDLAGKLEARRPSSEKEEDYGKKRVQWNNELAGVLKKIAGGEAKPPSVIVYGGTDGFGGGKSVECSILSKEHPVGTTPGDDAPIWADLEHLGLADGKTVRRTWYVQGHLLNHNLGGPGLRHNLTPLTKKANNDHKNFVENDLKALVNEKGKVISYKVKALSAPPKGNNARLATINAKTTLTADEKTEKKALEALNRLSAGFQCEAFVLERNKTTGKWEQKTSIPTASKPIENVIEEGGKTYGYHG